MATHASTTLDRALQINLDPNLYGTFAEIGAGQEVARFFFLAGKASQTIAKTMSAYDMAFSDEIYGPSPRYVCEERVKKMLDKEYSLLLRRLEEKRGAHTQFFTLANTVATGDGEKKISHGWMGVRFQGAPRAEPSEIILHVRLLDRYRLLQQQTLGILGVNLIFAAFFARMTPKMLIEAFLSEIKRGQIALDMIRVSGPEFKNFDPRELNFELVKMDLTPAILIKPPSFGQTGAQIQSPQDALFGKNVLVMRGQFNPLTISHSAVMKQGQAQFRQSFTLAGVAKAPSPANPDRALAPSEPKVGTAASNFQQSESDLLAVCELTTHAFNPDGRADEISTQDLIRRVEMCHATGFSVLVSKFYLFYQMKDFLREHTAGKIGLILPADHLDRVFDLSYYQRLPGGILEGLGRLLDADTRLLVYPHKKEGVDITAQSFKPSGALAHLYSYFYEQDFLVDLSSCEETDKYIHSGQARDAIQNRTPGWQEMVPQPVASLIESKKWYL